MFAWAGIFFVVAALSALFAFSGIATASAEIALILFTVFIAFFVVALAAGIMQRIRHG